MRASRKLRLLARFHNTVFVLLVLALAGMIGYLSQRYSRQWDVTQNADNSLSHASLGVLKQIRAPVTITAYATPSAPRIGNLHQAIRKIFAPYLRANANVTLHFVDPTRQPQRTRAAGIKINGEVVIRYDGRREYLTTLNESQITNALMRLARGQAPLIFYLSGHGERKLDGVANFDLGNFGNRLKTQGFKISALNLSIAPAVPANTRLLVIAAPQVNLLPGEVKKIHAYIQNGGNLLWLVDPGPLHGLQPLAEQLGLILTAGAVYDPAAGRLSLSPDMALGISNGAHPITRHFNLITVFPDARRVSANDAHHWRATPLIETAQGSCVTTSPINNNFQCDPGRDAAGPIAIAVALTRQTEDRTQRVVVVGDGAFLSNTFLGNGGNLDLGLHIVNWLSHDDRFIAIQPHALKDARLDLTPLAGRLIGLGYLVILPLLFLAGGIAVWRRRRRR